MYDGKSRLSLYPTTIEEVNGKMAQAEEKDRKKHEQWKMLKMAELELERERLEDEEAQKELQKREEQARRGYEEYRESFLNY